MGSPWQGQHLQATIGLSAGKTSQDAEQPMNCLCPAAAEKTSLTNCPGGAIIFRRIDMHTSSTPAMSATATKMCFGRVAVEYAEQTIVHASHPLFPALVVALVITI